MGKYTVEIRDQYGRLVTVINRPMKKEFAFYRNKPGYAQFTMDAFDPQCTELNFQMNKYDLVFRRKGLPLFAGQISYLQPKLDKDVTEVGIIANGYFDLLSQRMVNADFPGFDPTKQQLVYVLTDGATVINSLITNTQFPLSYSAYQTTNGTAPTLCQSFVAPASATVSQIRMLMCNNSATGNVAVSIYTDAGGVPSTTLVPNSQFTMPTSSLSNSPIFSWTTYNYITPPTLVNGQTYWLCMSLDSLQSGGNNVQWAYLSGNYYYNGRAYSPESPGMFASDQDLCFFLLMSDNSYQMTKNTYLGILQGTSQTSFNITRSIPQFKRLKDVIEEVSKLNNGIDFNITAQIDPVTNVMNKYVNVFYPRQGVDNTALNFTYPGNITKISKSKDGKSMSNVAYVRGQGSGAFQVVTTSVDTASVKTYGLREETEDFSDIPDSSTLQLLGNEFVRIRKDPLEVPEIELDGNKDPQVGSYGIGDSIFVNVNGPGILNFASIYRIEEIKVTIDDDDMEVVNLAVSRA